VGSMTDKSIDGCAVVINESAVLCLDNAGQVWSNSSETWALLPGLKGIQSLSFAEGTKLWYTQGVSGEDNPILHSLDHGANAVKTNGAAVQISAARDGEVWALTKASTLLRWNEDTSAWEPQLGELVQIAVANAKLQWGLDSKNDLHRRFLPDENWITVGAGPAGSSIKLLTVSADGIPFVVTSEGLAYMLLAETHSWVPIGSSDIKVRSLTILNFSKAWCVTLDGAPLSIGAVGTANATEVPFSEEVGAEWDTDNVFDENRSTHLYIVNRAIQLASNEPTLGALITATLQPMAMPPQSLAFRVGMCQGLYDADFKPEYNNPEKFFPWPFPYPSYKSHFYDESTGRNWMGEKSPTAFSNGVKFFDLSVGQMTSSNPSLYLAGYYLGLSLHYFTDLTQPMHAANYTFLTSTPFGYHRDFEAWLMRIQAMLRPQPKITGFEVWDRDAKWLYTYTAKQSKLIFFKAIEVAINYEHWDKIPDLWQERVTEFLPKVMDFAVGVTAQLIYHWASLVANDIKISNGTRLRVAGTDATYVVINNVLRYIPSRETYDNLFEDWGNVIYIPAGRPYPTGPDISAEASIVGATDDAPPADKKTYLLTNDKKLWITSAQVFARYGFDWKKLRKLTTGQLNAIPSGSPID
jgi:hypothetical protein